MQDESRRAAGPLPGVVLALGEAPAFAPGDRVRVATRSPVGHYRVPTYLRGKAGVVEAVIEPAGSTTRRRATAATPARGATTTASRSR